jgi:hypothetical protein
MQWDKRQDTNHKIELDLDVALTDFLHSKNIAAELTMKEKEIRKEIFLVVLNQILKKIVEDTGVSYDFEGQVHAKHHVDTHGHASFEKPKVEGETFVIRDRLKMVMNIETNRPLNAMQAIRASNHGIATAITDDILHHLKRKFLGITKSSTTTESEIDETGKLKQFDVNDKTDFTRN